MSEPNNRTIAIDALNAEIQERTRELDTLHAALVILQADPNDITITAAASSNGDGTHQATPSPPEVLVVEPRIFGRREMTAKLLAEFDRHEVASLEAATKRAGITVRQAGVGVLVRHGYLKAKGGGYVRTAKTFIP